MEEARIENLGESQDVQPKLSKVAVIKNLFIVSLSIFSVFAGFEATFLMQSTMNADKGIGVASQALISATGFLCALSLPKYIIGRFGCKATLACSAIGLGLYFSANFYPHWGTMVPAALISGPCVVLLWTSNSAYVNDLVAIYSSHIDSKTSKLSIDQGDGIPRNANGESCCIANKEEGERNYDTFNTENSNGIISRDICHTENPWKFPAVDIKQKDRAKGYTKKTFEYIAARFFGFNIVMYSLSHIVSSLMSYFILDINSEIYDVTVNSSCVCGPGFDDSESDCLKYNVLPPPAQLRYLLNGVGVALVLVSALLVLLLDPLETKKAPSKFTLDALFASARLFKNKKMLLLVPLTFSNGIMQAFFASDFTKAYISCSWGTNHVGLVMVFYGASEVVSSFLSGYLVKHLGRIPIFVANFAITLASIAYLLVWQSGWPHEYLFIGGTAFGLFNGVYASQVKALYGVLFKNDKEAAFGNYLLLYSLGTSMSFAYSAYLYTYVKIYILLAFFILGMLCYIILDGIVLRADMPKKRSIFKPFNSW